MDTTYNKLITKLIQLDTAEWRSLVCQVAWAYRMRRPEPKIYTRHVRGPLLPKAEWDRLRKEVTRARWRIQHAVVVEAKRRLLEDRRSYMRRYMRTYRRRELSNKRDRRSAHDNAV